MLPHEAGRFLREALERASECWALTCRGAKADEIEVLLRRVEDTGLNIHKRLPWPGWAGLVYNRNAMEL